MKPFAHTNEDIAKHIDPSKPVRDYRNLPRQCLSIMQSGKVACPAEKVLMQNFRFIVCRAGQKRVRETKRKNVHAFIEGYWTPMRLVPWASCYGDWVELYYNPYTCDGFINPYSHLSPQPSQGFFFPGDPLNKLRVMIPICHRQAARVRVCV